MATPRTGRPEGRPPWNLFTDRDNHRLGFFLAAIAHESQFRRPQKITPHAIALGLAAFECGAAAVSLKNPDKLHIENGKLLFKMSVTHAQIEAGYKANPIKARADLILRKFDRAMETPEYAGWLAEMAWAWTYALNEPDQLNALALSIMKCAAVGELAFFERALRPLIASRFDPSKRVIFTLPEFMPNFS